ncbi:MFS transporter [Adhaeribacter arboris]|uniref:MFS transporter n=1 Tax=Adhaeribacter arboris TaxID=2072846 RepID=A0A2T2YH32_9BACT|nr:MFS transporter [Adhaeribacter arboris]PSR54836.1 MFS transporter [Adhaeribacter arboris]
MPLPALSQSARMRYSTFFYLYVMQGIPSGFALTAIANYLNGRGVNPASIGTFVSIVGIPWIIQFFWGPIIDRYQYSVIGHRKQWVVLTQLAAFLASLTLLLVTEPLTQLSLLGLVFFTHSLFASVQDASVDAMAISVVPFAERGRLNACMRGGLLLGISFGAAALAYIMHQFGFRAAVLVQSGLLLLFTVFTFFIKLEPGDQLLPTRRNQAKKVSSEENPKLKIVFQYLWRNLTATTSLRTFGVIFVVYLCFSIFIRSFAFHLIQVLHWPDQDVSVLQGGWGSLITLSVVLGGGILADWLGPKKLQVKVMAVLAAFLIIFNLLAFLWDIRPFTISGLLFWNLADPLFSVAAFPILMTLCTEYTAGSQFTAYMAFINLSEVIGSYISGWALLALPAPVLGFSCGIVLLICMYILYTLNNESSPTPKSLAPEM